MENFFNISQKNFFCALVHFYGEWDVEKSSMDRNPGTHEAHTTINNRKMMMNAICVQK